MRPQAAQEALSATPDSGAIDLRAQPAGAVVDRAYIRRLDCQLLDLAVLPAATLASVAAGARGAFPALIAHRLRALDHHDVLTRPDRGEPPTTAPTGPELHPVDFEWYFEPDCAAAVADELRCGIGETLLFGAPTLAVSLRRRGKAALLVDRSPYLERRFGPQLGHALRHDLGLPLGQLRTHRVVFFDAPWHEDHIGRWLWQAALAVRRGGLIAFALFGELTRPAAEAERGRLLEHATHIGRVEVVHDTLRYRTPLFESAALAAGRTPLSASWRRGDLVLVNADHVTDLPVSPPAREQRWASWLVGDQVIKLRQPQGRSRSGVGHDEATWVLDTVSRRQSLRAGLDLWTSRNVVARGIDHKATTAFLKRLASERGLASDRSGVNSLSVASPS